jgi:hypothetical protein
MFTVGQALPCLEPGHPSQPFDLARSDRGGFPDNFPVRSRDDAGVEMCLQPYVAKEPTFDAVAFLRPDGYVSVVAQNKGDEPLTFTMYDETLGIGAEGLVAPPHSIQSYKLPPAPATVKAIGQVPTPSSQAGVMNPSTLVVDGTASATVVDAAAATTTGVTTGAPPSSFWMSPLGASGLALAVAAVGMMLRKRREVDEVDEGADAADEDMTPYKPLER